MKPKSFKNNNMIPNFRMKWNHVVQATKIQTYLILKGSDRHNPSPFIYDADDVRKLAIKEINRLKSQIRRLNRKQRNGRKPNNTLKMTIPSRLNRK
jgi:hypothetical protein